MKNVPIRTRLLAMLALPVVALAVAAGINVRRAGDQLDTRESQQHGRDLEALQVEERRARPLGVLARATVVEEAQEARQGQNL